MVTNGDDDDVNDDDDDDVNYAKLYLTSWKVICFGEG
jgi:hypothetical protein